MPKHYGEVAYRHAAASGATQVGLLLIVYDVLAEDLRRSGSCVRTGDVAGRCQSSNHALLLLGHLESWVEFLGEASLASALNQFYGFVRASVVRLQSKAESRDFYALADLIVETRAVWQKKEQLLLEELSKRNALPLPTDQQDDCEMPTKFLAWSA